MLGALVAWLVRLEARLNARPTRAEQEVIAAKVAHDVKGQFDEVKRLLLAVEVLSASTARADRVVKRAMFRDEGVAEFWIVDLDARTFERSTPGDSRVEVFDAEIMWRPEGASASLVIDLPGYFIEVLDS